MSFKEKRPPELSIAEPSENKINDYSTTTTFGLVNTFEFLYSVTTAIS